MGLKMPGQSKAKQPVMTKSVRTLRILRIASGFAAFLYLIFGLLLEPVLGVDDLIPLTHRLLFAAAFGGLVILSYIISFVQKHMGILFYTLAVGAIVNLIFMGVQEGYDAGAIVALLLVIPVMNFLFYRWKALLYANILLLLGVIGSFIISSPSPLNLLLFIVSSIAISGASFWGARRLLSTEQRAEKSEKLYTNLFYNSLEGIALHEMILDDKGKPVDYIFLEANPAFEAHTGLRLKDVLGKRATEVFPCKECISFIEAYGTVVQTEQSVVFEQFSEFLQRFYRVAAYPLGVKQFVTVFEDITERKKVEKQTLYLSFHDQLTGLYNRRFYEEELKRTDVPRNLPISIIMADLDDLKLTNDTFGHQAGDELLKALANVLKNVCRKDEIVARIGGDEFVILLPKTGSQGAEKLVERIKSEISKNEVSGVNLSVSFGWHTKNMENELFENVFKQAEDMMYHQKNPGRNSH